MSKLRTVVCDIETNGLLPHADTIWCIVAKDYDTGEMFLFDPDNLHEFPEFAKTVSTWIGHNFIAFDSRVLKKVLGVRIRPNKIRDSLIISRLQKQDRLGGHSLEAWGEALGCPKLDHDDWTQFSPEMMKRCIQDVELNTKVAQALKSEAVRYGSRKAELIENQVQSLLEDQKEYGFQLDLPKVMVLYGQVSDRANELRSLIEEGMVPWPKFDRLITPKRKADSELSKVGLKGFDLKQVAGPFSRIVWVPFNIDSTKQKVERLNLYWKPYQRTRGYKKLRDDPKVSKVDKERRFKTMWLINDENLATLPDTAPQSLKHLTEYAMCTSRVKLIEGWLEGIDRDNRVHGSVYSIGAITHRMAHRDPNTGNIPGEASPYGLECRDCFTVRNPETHSLLGVDASGIQLRVLAHYMNDPDYTHEVVHGDIHTKNLLAMGIDKGKMIDGKWTARGVAKTFIYAWLLGAGDAKVGTIIGAGPVEGRRVKEQFLRNTPALADLKRRAGQAARLGGLVGFDGRWLPIKSEHYALSSYLQGGESCIMKLAMILYHHRLNKLGYEFQQLAVVHDEFQIEVLNEDAEEIGKIVVQAIVDAGVHFNLNVPMDGEYKIGKTWKETH